MHVPSWTSSGLGERLALHRERQPGGAALRSGDLTLRYGELAGAVDTLAHALKALPAGALALHADNGIDWALVDLAALAAGRALVPIPPFFSAEQRLHALATAGVNCELRPRSDALARIACDPANTPEALVEALHACVHDVAVEAAHVRGAGNADGVPPGTAKITFTSGTTGRPKGVCLSAETMAEVTRAVATAVGPLGVQRHLCVLPLSTLLENLAGLHAALWHGVECLVPPLPALGIQGSSSIDVMSFIGGVLQSGADSLILVPQLLMALTIAAERGVPLQGYRFIAVGGARTSPALIARAHARGLPVYEGYGLSECASVCCLNLPGATREGSVGRALGQARIEIAGDGEVLVHGRTMLGYAGDAAATHSGNAAPEPHRTGDLGRLDDDGFLFIDGRKRNVFITAFGRNVSPEWVEGELTSDMHIAHALVVGEAQPDNVAVLVPRGDAGDAELATAVAQVNDRLPDYARIARWVRAPAEHAAGLFTENGRLRREQATSRWRPLIESLYPPAAAGAGAALTRRTS